MYILCALCSVDYELRSQSCGYPQVCASDIVISSSDLSCAIYIASISYPKIHRDVAPADHSDGRRALDLCRANDRAVKQRRSKRAITGLAEVMAFRAFGHLEMLCLRKTSTRNCSFALRLELGVCCS